MSDDNNTSTLKSYVNSATETVQNAIGSVTGSNTSNQQASTTDSQPTTSSDKPTPYPKWNQTVGSAKESFGNITGNENLRRAGIDQNKQGKAEEAEGQVKDWGEGMADRAQGAVGSVGAAIKGDREEEDKWRKIHDEGKAQAKEAQDEMEKRGGY
ncbi:hypothetical protein PHISCL_06272 [Aspergillus sclerotialis]|uniref:CsbD-like domain-containing protein n=1 Tax=Aspergillus sclerotialis TaxID=2070753 RepID=A0A3A2ZE17_9EURO|nr:hypothetical protein PHISCL_06272 [Aspergillus sclerotialis]